MSSKIYVVGCEWGSGWWSMYKALCSISFTKSHNTKKVSTSSHFFELYSSSMNITIPMHGHLYTTNVWFLHNNILVQFEWITLIITHRKNEQWQTRNVKCKIQKEKTQRWERWDREWMKTQYQEGLLTYVPALGGLNAGQCCNSSCTIRMMFTVVFELSVRRCWAIPFLALFLSPFTCCLSNLSWIILKGAWLILLSVPRHEAGSIFSCICLSGIFEYVLHMPALWPPQFGIHCFLTLGFIG